MGGCLFLSKYGGGWIERGERRQRREGEERREGGEIGVGM